VSAVTSMSIVKPRYGAQGLYRTCMTVPISRDRRYARRMGRAIGMPVGSHPCSAIEA
jgi:hypothetical protein